MTKEELIKSFERNNWELHEIYKAKLLALNYGELAKLESISTSKIHDSRLAFQVDKFIY